jgi:hypothetical protein
MRRSIVLFALNEVPWEVLDDYVAARPTVAVDHLASYAFYLPDAFASEPVAHPPELVAFQRFNLVMSRESGRNIDTGIAKKDAFEVVRHSRRLGIRPATYAAVGKQLLAERRRPAMSNRRRTYQSVLLFDIFARQLRRTRPRFSTFFRPDDYEQLGLGQD